MTDFEKLFALGTIIQLALGLHGIFMLKGFTLVAQQLDKIEDILSILSNRQLEILDRSRKESKKP